MATIDARGTLEVGDDRYEIHRLSALDGDVPVGRLPYSLKVLLENLLRNVDGVRVTDDDVAALASWSGGGDGDDEREISFLPARVLMQDFTGVPAVVDLAAMRTAVADRGGDPQALDPLIPADLVIDHSVQVDVFGRPDALARNAELEYRRNLERYQFLRWGQEAFGQFRVVPPATGICHQVNLEYLATVVATRGGAAFPDTLVGTDSHTPMVNGLGVVGWGVGGIEAEAALLGQPISMLIPRVVGVKLVGELPEGTTATDLVLTVTNLLRAHGVVGHFVEFYGPGVANVPLENRATIGNMSPEYGSTITIFPIDGETLRYLRFTGRPDAQVALVEAYAKEQGMWHDPGAEPVFTERLDLDLSSVEPSIAGPARPQDRVPLREARSRFAVALLDSLPESERPPATTPVSIANGYDQADALSFPASDPPSAATGRASHEHQVPEPAAPDAGDAVEERPRQQVPVRLDASAGLDEETEVVLDHGHVAIAAITSCTNTSNPQVMVGAGLVARKAVERGLSRRPWVKTSLAPGSKVVVDYLDRAGLLPDLAKLGFDVVGFGCTTCIGNSGPLPPPIAAAAEEHGLALVSVLSGNRNFEGRINPDVRMNYLASPPLVVAYALAGTMDVDLTSEPLAEGADGQPVYLRDLWPTSAEVNAVVEASLVSDMFRAAYGRVFDGDELWRGLPVPEGGAYEWSDDSTYVRRPPYFDEHAGPARAAGRHRRRPTARAAGRQRDDRSHLPRRGDPPRQPGRPVAHRPRGRARRLQLVRVAPGQPRGDDPGHVRQPPHPQPAGARHRGRRHRPPAERRADVDLRRRRAVPGRGRAARGAGGQGVRLRVVAGLGGEGDGPARGPGGDRRELRADPPVQPHRHGRPAAAARRRGDARIARTGRRRRGRRQVHAARPGGRRAGNPARRPPRGRGRGRHRAGGGPARHADGGRLLRARRHPPVRPPPAPGGRRGVTHLASTASARR